MAQKLAFVHGWGFHAGVWDDIAPHFSACDVSFHGPEYVRGGPAVMRNIPSSAIVVGFSYGVAQVLCQPPNDIRALVAVCGFDSLARRGREAAIMGLLSGLRRNAWAQMSAFWANCGVNRFADEEALNVSVLEHHLCEMLHVDAREQLAALDCPTLALSSRDDKVVPLRVSMAVWEGRPMKLSGTGGHALPLTRAQWCVDEISNFLESDVPQISH